MFLTIAKQIKRDADYPERAYTADVYTRVLEGAFYDHLTHGFHVEKVDGDDEYIPLRNRRPSVRYNLCRLVADDSVSLLFSEGHFPTADCKSKEVKDGLAALMKEGRLNEVMLNAATTGSVGSVAIWLRVLKQTDDSHRAFYSVHRTKYLTPTFSAVNPELLIKMREQYKVRGEVLRGMGYVIKDADVNTDFWFARDWDLNAEVWYLPWKVKDAPATEAAATASTDAMPFTPDTSKGVKHNLGFVPWVWVRNLPGDLKLIAADAGDLTFSDIDGACTFAGAIDSMIEIDYQLSQAGRGLKYNMDPILLLKEPVAEPLPLEKGGSTISVDEGGDGKMLEIGGSAFTVVVEYVKSLRDLALEAIHGNRVDANKLSTAQSGRAMELMNQALIWLSDRLRVSYGEGALLSLLNMTLKANEKFPITVDGKPLPKVGKEDKVTLIWPDWYPPTATDRQANATTLKTHKDSGHISRETAVKSIANTYDIEDVAAELARIAKDQADELAMVAATAEAKANISTTV